MGIIHEVTYNEGREEKGLKEMKVYTLKGLKGGTQELAFATKLDDTLYFLTVEDEVEVKELPMTTLRDVKEIEQSDNQVGATFKNKLTALKSYVKKKKLEDNRHKLTITQLEKDLKRELG